MTKPVHLATFKSGAGEQGALLSTTIQTVDVDNNDHHLSNPPAEDDLDPDAQNTSIHNQNTKTRSKPQTYIREILKSWRLSAIYRLFSSIKDLGTKTAQIRHDKERVVIFKNRPLTLLSALIHVPPIVASCVLTWLVFQETWIGATLTTNGTWDRQAEFLIQVAAKFLESAIIASLATIIFTFVRHESSLGKGAPLAAFFSKTDFEDVSYMFSDGFMAILTGRFSNWGKKGLFILLLVVSNVLAILVAPAAATILLPLEDWYVMGGTRVWADASWANVLGGEGVTENSTLPDGVCEVTGNPRCPSAGWETIQHTARLLPSMASTVMPNVAGLDSLKGQQEWNEVFTLRMPSLDSWLDVSYRVRNPDAPIDTFFGESFATMPHRVTGALMANASNMWSAGVRLARDIDGRWYSGSQHKYSAFSTAVAVRTRCTASNVSMDTLREGTVNGVVFPDVRLFDPSKPDNNLYGDLEIEDVPLIKDFLDTLANTDSGQQQAQLRFFELPDYLQPNASVGAVIAIPSSSASSQQPNNDDLALYGCLMTAQWLNTPLFVSSENIVSTRAWPLWTGWDNPIRVSPIYADLINARLRDSSTNRTVFSALAEAADIVPSSESNIPTIQVETLLTLLLANGLSRTAPQVQPQFKLLNPSGPWWHGLFPPPGQTFDVHPGQSIFVDPGQEADLMFLDFRAEMLGYAYTNRKNTTRNAVIGLLVYTSVAVLFIIWSLIVGVTSSSWQSTPEMTMLALRSTPPSREKLPSGANLENIKPLAETYCILAEGRQVRLGHVEGVVPVENRVRPNVVYE